MDYGCIAAATKRACSLDQRVYLIHFYALWGAVPDMQDSSEARRSAHKIKRDIFAWKSRPEDEGAI